MFEHSQRWIAIVQIDAAANWCAKDAMGLAHWTDGVVGRERLHPGGYTEVTIPLIQVETGVFLHRQCA